MLVPINDWNNLGGLLRGERVSQGLTQASLAERAGVSRAWLAKVEAGHRGLELEQLLRLLDALGITMMLRTDETRAQARSWTDSAGRVLRSAGASEKTGASTRTSAARVIELRNALVHMPLGRLDREGLNRELASLLASMASATTPISDEVLRAIVQSVVSQTATNRSTQPEAGRSETRPKPEAATHEEGRQ